MNCEDMIIGAMWYGCGGGGNVDEARELLQQVLQSGSPPPLLDPSACSDEDIFITAFGVGASGVTDQGAMQIAHIKKYLLPLLPRPPKGIIAVEIGPKSIAQACFVAHQLGVALVDADIVGGRASPEVYLESITLHNISRTPLIAMNQRGDVCLYLQSAGPQAEEQIIRSFSSASGGQISVAGYHLNGKQVRECLEPNTLSRCERTGALLRQGQSDQLIDELQAKYLFQGTLAKLIDRPTQSFLERDVFLENGNSQCRVYIRNETLIAWIDSNVCAECPSLIIMTDRNGFPIANSALEIGMQLTLYSCKPSAVWCTDQGRALFSPAQFIL